MKLIPWIMLAVGIVVAVVAGVLGVTGVVNAVTPTTTWTAPAPQAVTLPEGEWVVYEETTTTLVPRSSGGSRREVTGERTVSVEDVTVSGPNGPVAVACDYCAGINSESITVNNVGYIGIARFRADTSGSYTVNVASRGARMMIAASVGATVMKAFGYVGLLILGLVLAFAGLVWGLVWVFMSHSKKNRPQPAYAAGAPTMAAAGRWLPDPDDATQWRWWDGHQWTDQRSPRE